MILAIWCNNVQSMTNCYPGSLPQWQTTCDLTHWHHMTGQSKSLSQRLSRQMIILRISKDFFGGVKYHQWIKSLLLLAVFWPFNRYYFHPKNLASFLVILVQGYSKGSQKSLYRGLPHHFGIVQNGSFRSENFRKSANDP